jgi:hypothetical protein
MLAHSERFFSSSTWPSAIFIYCYGRTRESSYAGVRDAHGGIYTYGSLAVPCLGDIAGSFGGYAHNIMLIPSDYAYNHGRCWFNATPDTKTAQCSDNT